jgi:hypothetical protein
MSYNMLAFTYLPFSDINDGLSLKVYGTSEVLVPLIRPTIRRRIDITW